MNENVLAATEMATQDTRPIGVQLEELMELADGFVTMNQQIESRLGRGEPIPIESTTQTNVSRPNGVSPRIEYVIRELQTAAKTQASILAYLEIG